MKRNAKGFNTIELTVALSLGLILSGLSMVGFNQTRAMLAANSGEEMVSSKLRQAREMAISQRKQIVVTFVSPDQILIGVQVSRDTRTPLERYSLPAGAVFNPGMGNPPENLPAAVNLRDSSIAFYGDGSARDAITGGLINGVIYLSNADSTNLTALGAVTTLGPTGRVRTYHYDAGRGGWF